MSAGFLGVSPEEIERAKRELEMTPAVTVLGIGNVILQDEGFGVRAAELLRDYMRSFIARQTEPVEPETPTIAEALGGYHPAAEIEIEFERDKSLPRTIAFD